MTPAASALRREVVAELNETMALGLGHGALTAFLGLSGGTAHAGVEARHRFSRHGAYWGRAGIGLDGLGANPELNYSAMAGVQWVW